MAITETVIHEWVAKFVNWVTKHFGEAIWAILAMGVVLIFLGGILTENKAWRISTGNNSGTIQEMFSERSFEDFLDTLTIRTLEPLGIEIIGAVVVAIGFVLLRDSNREKIATLEKKIDDLKAGQEMLMEALTNMEITVSGKTDSVKRKTSSRSKK